MAEDESPDLHDEPSPQSTAFRRAGQSRAWRVSRGLVIRWGNDEPRK